VNQSEVPRDAKEGEQKGPIEGWTAAMVGDGVKVSMREKCERWSSISGSDLQVVDGVTVELSRAGISKLRCR
jgi:hypothetical protein